jgi:predicted nucleic acid-binding protein
VAELDQGEASVIALARTLLPCTVIIDERRGRRVAHLIYGLPIRGTADLLVEARRRGLVGDLRPMLEQLKAAGYFLASSVIDAACQAAEHPH